MDINLTTKDKDVIKKIENSKHKTVEIIKSGNLTKIKINNIIEDNISEIDIKYLFLSGYLNQVSQNKYVLVENNQAIYDMFSFFSL